MVLIFKFFGKESSLRGLFWGRDIIGDCWEGIVFFCVYFSGNISDQDSCAVWGCFMGLVGLFVCNYTHYSLIC